MNRVRTALALGLVLLLGSVRELPHRHSTADGTLHTPHATQMFDAASVSEDGTCPVCVLQRLLSQAQIARFSSLEKPSASGSITPSPAPRVADSVTRSGSPRGPPASA